MEIQVLLDKKGVLARSMQDVFKDVGNDVSKWSAEVRAKYEAMETEYDATCDLAEKAERQNKREADLRSQIKAPVELPGTDSRGKVTLGAGTEDPEKEKRAAIQRYLLRGNQGITEAEHRALAADQDIYGGFIVPPKETLNFLLQKVKDQFFLKKLAKVVQLNKAVSLGFPTLDTRPSDAAWTAEILTGSEDSSMAFGGRELTPHPLAKRIKISNKLLRSSAIDIEALIMEEFGYMFAKVEEQAYLTGDGNNKPLGVFTASDKGISTARDVSTDNTTTAITADGLINVKYSLRPGYLPGCVWLFHRDAIKQIRKLKDGNGQYLWLPGLQQGQPDRILDHPFYMSEYVPNTFTTGLYVGMFGNFAYYMIAEALNMQVQRLVELYAEQNQIGFICRRELDGMPILEEAFTRIKLA